jgi:hypothetical protein
MTSVANTQRFNSLTVVTQQYTLFSTLQRARLVGAHTKSDRTGLSRAPSLSLALPLAVGPPYFPPHQTMFAAHATVLSPPQAAHPLPPHPRRLARQDVYPTGPERAAPGAGGRGSAHSRDQAAGGWRPAAAAAARSVVHARATGTWGQGPWPCPRGGTPTTASTPPRPQRPARRPAREREPRPSRLARRRAGNGARRRVWRGVPQRRLRSAGRFERPSPLRVGLPSPIRVGLPSPLRVGLPSPIRVGLPVLSEDLQPSRPSFASIRVFFHGHSESPPASATVERPLGLRRLRRHPTHPLTSAY